MPYFFNQIIIIVFVKRFGNDVDDINVLDNQLISMYVWAVLEA